MAQSSPGYISDKHCPRFGQAVVEMWFIAEAQPKEALCSQAGGNLAGQGCGLLGATLFDRGWMTGEQIGQVMNALLKKMRKEVKSG
ncbi:MAG: hypothetical protein FD134_2823 [Gallionellaceae bacterium]|nr:MAG: hypothetical protein FD134_2823 [Gallionellaceae bacterium]